jgi:hypothetical protein
MEVLFLSNVRLSFPQLVEPRSAKKGGVPKYSADFLLEPNSPEVQKFFAEVQKAATEKWKEHAAAVLQIVQNDRKLRCYGKGEEKVNGKTFKVYEGYEGKVYISANKEQMPKMIQADGSPIDATNTMAYQQLARKLYGGCYVNAAVRPWLQENEHGRGVRCDLLAVQFNRDGQPFGEAVADASAMFGAVASAAPNPLQTSQFPSMNTGGMPSFLG